jgi:lipopolysaccharide transport system permease protein
MNAEPFRSSAQKKTLRSLSIQPEGPGLVEACREIWACRGTLMLLAQREVGVRYKQTFLGVLWVVVQPLASAAILAFFLGRLGNLPSEGMSYTVFCFSGMVPWTFVSSAVTRATGSLVGQINLVTKVYFPRQIIPLAAVLSAVPDLVILLVLTVSFIFVKVGFSLAALLAFLQGVFLALLTATGISLWLSSLNVRYRDVSIVLPFLLQVWMFASPVLYSATLIPEPWRFWFGLNPLAGVINAFRAGFSGGAWPSLETPSWIAATIIAVTGWIYFHRAEGRFADVI